MKLKKTTVAASVAGVSVILGAQAAFASTTLSVDGTTSPAGSVSVAGTTGVPGSGSSYLGPLAFETDYGVPATCQQGDATGYVLRGASGGTGTKVGAITDLDFITCLATDLDFPVLAYNKTTPAEWGIFLDETPAKAQRYVKVEVRGISAQMNSTTAVGTWNCALNVTGTVKGTIDTTLDRLIINTPSLTGAALQNPLLVDALDASGNKAGSTGTSCGGEVQDGDKASMTGTFQLNRNIEVS